MIKISRRGFMSFMTKTGILAGTGTAITLPVMAATDRLFIHHVYFWLKNPESEQDKAKLIEGLKKLSKVSTIKEFHIGAPAATNRDVIERSYQVSWMLKFKNKSDQDSYQNDPIHLNFVDTCSSLWSKVIVYDSEDI